MTRTVTTVLFTIAILCMAAAFLAGCQHQPPCGDCWLAIPKEN